MKVHPLLVGLDDVAPVEEVVVVHHSPREVGLAQYLRFKVRSVRNIFFFNIRNAEYVINLSPICDQRDSHLPAVR